MERESLSWVNRLHSGAFSVEDADAFRRWRSSDPANEAAFVEAIRFRRRGGRNVEKCAAGLTEVPECPGLPAGQRPAPGAPLKAEDDLHLHMCTYIHMMPTQSVHAHRR
uniref:FecR/PupR family sigma factor regulator n=1 Tax=uncultured Caulobacter sp. TaxID=158749 RepID=UPI00345BB562